MEARQKLENKDYGMRWDEANSGRFDPDGDVTVLFTGS
jgi:hypothetical protein